MNKPIVKVIYSYNYKSGKAFQNATERYRYGRIWEVLFEESCICSECIDDCSHGFAILRKLEGGIQ